MFPAPDEVKKLNDFFWTEDDGQFFRHLWSRDDVCEGPVFLEGDSIEEAKRCDGNSDRTCRKFFLIRQMDLVGPNVLRSQQSGDSLKCRANRETVGRKTPGCSRLNCRSACLRSSVGEVKSWSSFATWNALLRAAAPCFRKEACGGKRGVQLKQHGE
jgi:hypothetical protein